MKNILKFLGHGFALFAGGPAMIFPNPALGRSAMVMQAQKRERGPSQW
jgi:hypothetical protein